MFNFVFEAEKVDSEFMPIVPNARVLVVMPHVSEIVIVADTAAKDSGIVVTGISKDEITVTAISSLLVLVMVCGRCQINDNLLVSRLRHLT